MKTIILLILLVFSIILNVALCQGYNKLETKINTPQTIFIWNDDEESIPMDNSLITLEFTKGDTIYVGPYNKLAKPN